MLKGLECSEVRFSHALASAETKRFDPEYFQKQFLSDEQHVALAQNQFVSFSDLGIKIDASAFYPSIEEYYGQGELPFLRVADVDAVIDFEQCTRIPAELCEKFLTLSRVRPGDIVFTKGGSVARIGLVTREAAVSRDLIFLNSSRLPESERIFLYLYFQTAFFNRMLLRSSSQTAQPHLTITLVRNLPVFIGSSILKTHCMDLVKASYEKRAHSIRSVAEAEQTLLRALGLENWQTPEPLTYTRRASEAFAVRRLDSQFFFPRYDSLRNALESRFEVKELGEVGEVLKGMTVPYYEDGSVPIIRSGDLSDISDDNRFLRSNPLERIFYLERGDVLISSIGFGSIGKVQVFDKSGRYGTVSEVSVVRQSELNPYYLTFFLRSQIGQMQIERYITGATGQLHLYPRDVAGIFVPVLPQVEQSKFQKLAEAANIARREARELLERAKRAVEIAIETDETAALRYLKQ